MSSDPRKDSPHARDHDVLDDCDGATVVVLGRTTENVTTAPVLAQWIRRG